MKYIQDLVNQRIGPISDGGLIWSAYQAKQKKQNKATTRLEFAVESAREKANSIALAFSKFDCHLKHRPSIVGPLIFSNRPVRYACTMTGLYFLLPKMTEPFDVLTYIALACSLNGHLPRVPRVVDDLGRLPSVCLGAMLGTAYGFAAGFQTFGHDQRLSRPVSQNLPIDVWEDILGYLSFEQKRKIRQVSRGFFEIAEKKRQYSQNEFVFVDAQANLREQMNVSETTEEEYKRLEDAINVALLPLRIDRLNAQNSIYYSDQWHDTSLDWIVSLFASKQVYLDLPILYPNIPAAGGSGTGYIDYIDPVKDLSSPLMRGFSRDGTRPFVVARIQLERTSPVSGDREVISDDTNFLVLWQRYAEQQYSMPGDLWMLSAYGNQFRERQVPWHEQWPDGRSPSNAEGSRLFSSYSMSRLFAGETIFCGDEKVRLLEV